MSENKQFDKQVPSSYGSAAVTPDPLRTVPLETPRTDSVEAHAESEWIHGHEEDGFRRVLKHARDLERELEEALIHAGKETGRAEAALSARGGTFICPHCGADIPHQHVVDRKGNVHK